MRPNLYPSDISQSLLQESEGAETNPIILIKHFLLLQHAKCLAVYIPEALIQLPSLSSNMQFGLIPANTEEESDVTIS